MNALKSWTLSLLVSAAAFAAACAPAAMAATPAAAAHEHGDAATTKLRLDHGRKWATDAPLRDGMGRIRALVAPQLPLAHQGKMSPEQYAALAAKVEVEVGQVVANCKLAPEADAVLHGILSDLTAGTGEMAGRNPGARGDRGLVQVAAAVNAYGRYFEHSGFQPIAIGH